MGAGSFSGRPLGDPPKQWNWTAIGAAVLAAVVTAFITQGANCYEDVVSFGAKTEQLDGRISGVAQEVQQLRMDMNRRFSEVSEEFSEVNDKFSEVDDDFDGITNLLMQMQRTIGRLGVSRDAANEGASDHEDSGPEAAAEDALREGDR